MASQSICDENGASCFAVGAKNKTFSECNACGLKYFINKHHGVCALCWPQAVRTKNGWSACACPKAMAAMAAAREALQLQQGQAQQMSQAIVAARASIVPPESDRGPQEAAALDDGNLMMKLGRDMESISTAIAKLGSDSEKNTKALDAKTAKLDSELCSMHKGLESINARLSQLEYAQEEIVGKCAELGQLHDPTMHIQMENAMGLMTTVLERLETMIYKMKRARLISTGELEAGVTEATYANDHVGSTPAETGSTADEPHDHHDDAWQEVEFN